MIYFRVWDCTPLLGSWGAGWASLSGKAFPIVSCTWCGAYAPFTVSKSIHTIEGLFSLPGQAVWFMWPSQACGHSTWHYETWKNGHNGPPVTALISSLSELVVGLGSSGKTTVGCRKETRKESGPAVVLRTTVGKERSWTTRLLGRQQRDAYWVHLRGERYWLSEGSWSQGADPGWLGEVVCI